MGAASSLTFYGHEYKAPLQCAESFEHISDEQLHGFDAVIVPSGIVADRLRYTEDVAKLPPATEFLQRAFVDTSIIKGIICHGLWLVAPAPELVHGRPVTAHNNLLGDVRNMGASYTDHDVVVDGDLVTGRSGPLCHLFARTIIDRLNAKNWILSRPSDTGVAFMATKTDTRFRIETGRSPPARSGPLTP